MGGGSATGSPAQVTAGYVSLLAPWMGGACAPRVTPPIPPVPPISDDGGGRNINLEERIQWEQDQLDVALQQDEIEVLNLANFVIMLLWPDD